MSPVSLWRLCHKTSVFFNTKLLSNFFKGYILRSGRNRSTLLFIKMFSTAIILEHVGSMFYDNWTNNAFTITKLSSLISFSSVGKGIQKCCLRISELDPVSWVACNMSTFVNMHFLFFRWILSSLQKLCLKIEKRDEWLDKNSTKIGKYKFKQEKRETKRVRKVAHSVKKRHSPKLKFSFHFILPKITVQKWIFITSYKIIAYISRFFSTQILPLLRGTLPFLWKNSSFGISFYFSAWFLMVIY
jgi:hypothetical protein